jgi:hypothetical protein
MDAKNFTQWMIALSNWFENARHDLAMYLFSTTRRVHGTLDAAPATATGVVVDRILRTEDCHFVTRVCRPHAFQRAGAGRASAAYPQWRLELFELEGHASALGPEGPRAGSPSRNCGQRGASLHADCDSTGLGEE